MTMTVDEFVLSRVHPDQRETVATLRAVVREVAPAAEEQISYGMPVFRTGTRIFAWITPGRNHISFGFRAGTSLEDGFDRLRGAGKHARHIRYRDGDSVDRDVLGYYITQAVALDADQVAQSG